MPMSETFANTIQIKDITIGKEPLVMGILNVTPDSFFEGSRKQTRTEIEERVRTMLGEGAKIIDVGACSTRPGSVPVDAENEKKRLDLALSIIRTLTPEAVVSIDTFRPEIAEWAINEYGVDIINDISGGNTEMFKVVGKNNTPYVLMSQDASIEEVECFFKNQMALLADCGCTNIVLDPGYGFGKDIKDNYSVLRQQERLLSFGVPLLVGVSRKRMIWQLLRNCPDKSLEGTIAVNMSALERGAHILRVHDVRAAYETIEIFKALNNC